MMGVVAGVRNRDQKTACTWEKTIMRYTFINLQNCLFVACYLCAGVGQGTAQGLVRELRRGWLGKQEGSNSQSKKALARGALRETRAQVRANGTASSATRVRPRGGFSKRPHREAFKKESSTPTKRGGERIESMFLMQNVVVMLQSCLNFNLVFFTCCKYQQSLSYLAFFLNAACKPVMRNCRATVPISQSDFLASKRIQSKKPSPVPHTRSVKLYISHVFPFKFVIICCPIISFM